jgi:serine/threonine protein kinase
MYGAGEDKDHNKQAKYKQIAGITELVKELGRGSYGRIFLGQQIQKPRLYFVVKCVSIRYASPAGLEEMEKKLNQVVALESPYIVKLYFYIRTDTVLYLYFDYCDGGSLEEYIKQKSGPMSEA